MFKLAGLARSGAAALAEGALPGYAPAPPPLAPSEAVRPPSYFSPSAASRPPAILAQPSACRALTALHRGVTAPDPSPTLPSCVPGVCGRRSRTPCITPSQGPTPASAPYHATRRGLREAFPLPTHEMGAASPSPVS